MFNVVWSARLHLCLYVRCGSSNQINKEIKKMYLSIKKNNPMNLLPVHALNLTSMRFAATTTASKMIKFFIMSRSDDLS